MIGNFLGHFGKPHPYVKTELATFGKMGYFLDYFWKNGLLFTPTSGHTGVTNKFQS